MRRCRNFARLTQITRRGVFSFHERDGRIPTSPKGSPNHASVSDHELKALVRERFTKTAEVFGDYAVAERVAEAESLARLVAAGPGDVAVDLACGPGTLALRFAKHVRWMCAYDLTPAILQRARQSAAQHGLLDKLGFAIGDAQTLPFAEARWIWR